MTNTRNAARLTRAARLSRTPSARIAARCRVRAAPPDSVHLLMEDAMSIITKITSNIILLIVAVAWALLCMAKKELLPLPDNIMYVCFVLFAGDRGIDFIISKFGNQKTKEVANGNNNTT